jgi:SAM-dependent methyltransferase
VGGLARKLEGRVSRYLGVDSSFASIALARHLALGCDYSGALKFPEDLLLGTTSRSIAISPAPARISGHPADFVVGHLEEAPLAQACFDLSIVLNAIDMLDKPAQLPELQARTLKKSGIAIQSCPYIWHESVAKSLRGRLPRGMVDSARAVEWLYEQAGLKIKDSLDQIPWLFFKHVRQIELYSVHLFVSEKTGA